MIFVKIPGVVSQSAAVSGVSSIKGSVVDANPSVMESDVAGVASRAGAARETRQSPQPQDVLELSDAAKAISG